MTTIYNNAKELLLSGQIDFTSDVTRVALVSDDTAYTPNPDTEAFVADVFDGGVTATEFTGTGYARQSLAGAAVTQDDVDDEGVFDANDLTFSGIDGDTVQGVLLYKQVGADDTTPADDPVIVYLTSPDFPMPANGGDITIQWDAEGILNLG